MEHMIVAKCHPALEPAVRAESGRRHSDPLVEREVALSDFEGSIALFTTLLHIFDSTPASYFAPSTFAKAAVDKPELRGSFALNLVDSF